MTEDKPKKLTYTRSFFDGYDHMLCIQCKNDKQTIDIDNIQIIQKPKFSQKIPPVTGKISKISNLGKMEIDFNQIMMTNTTDFNFTILNNKTLIEMYLNPANDWHLSKKDYNLSRLNFTWNCTSYEKKTMKFDLIFNNPIEISP